MSFESIIPRQAPADLAYYIRGSNKDPHLSIEISDAMAAKLGIVVDKTTCELQVGTGDDKGKGRLALGVGKRVWRIGKLSGTLGLRYPWDTNVEDGGFIGHPEGWDLEVISMDEKAIVFTLPSHEKPEGKPE
ncbi:MAG: hypothetical protein JWO08_1173 [Verrucomicrobiaceae bacterium]|nr:hypothetical protein [Verrucomicrobiaceae bacterium]